MNVFVDRMIRAARLDAMLYEEVEGDKGAMGQAIGVVLLSSAAAGVGGISKGGISGVLVVTFAALAGWYLWACLTYLIGTKILPGPQTRTDLGELLRTTGFSSSPGLVRVLGIIPGLSLMVLFVSAVWMLAAMVVAIKQALDYTSAWRAVAVCAIGWGIQFVLMAIIF